MGYTPDHVFFEADGLGQYGGASNSRALGQTGYGNYTSGVWLDVPRSYDRSNRTPETLMVWLHGCNGSAYYDAQTLSYVYSRDRHYIVAALSGPEDGGLQANTPNCWDPFSDMSKVLRDIAVVESHFNIDRRRVFIGGYSSGGDVAWETIFTYARTFAGILAVNTNPVQYNQFGFRWGLDGIGHAIRTAAWKFHVVQVDHTNDDAYHLNRCGLSGYRPCAIDSSGRNSVDFGVTPTIHALQAAGFPVIYTIRPGHHYDPGAPAGCDSHYPAICTSGTYHDVARYLLPYLNRRSWLAPAR